MDLRTKKKRYFSARLHTSYNCGIGLSNHGRPSQFKMWKSGATQKPLLPVILESIWTYFSFRFRLNCSVRSFFLWLWICLLGFWFHLNYASFSTRSNPHVYMSSLLNVPFACRSLRVRTTSFIWFHFLLPFFSVQACCNPF